MPELFFGVENGQYERERGEVAIKYGSCTSQISKQAFIIK